jgi:hypothetical protein
MAAMNMVSAGGFSGVSFHLRRFPQGVASVFCKKTPIFGPRGSKLDQLTVYTHPRSNTLAARTGTSVFTHQYYTIRHSRHVTVYYGRSRSTHHT